jgi:hypothetical protein
MTRKRKPSHSKVFPPRPSAKEDASSFARDVARSLTAAGLPATVLARNEISLENDLGLRVSKNTRKQTTVYSISAAHTIVFSRRETQFLNPTPEERRLAAEIGLDHTASTLVARRRSNAETSLLRHRIEEVRKARGKPAAKPGAATEEDATRLLIQSNVPAEVRNGRLYYRGTALANARIEGGRLAVEAGGPALTVTIVPPPDADDGRDIAESLHRMFEPRWHDLHDFMQLLESIGEPASLEPEGLRTGGSLIALTTSRHLSHVVAESTPSVLLASSRYYLLPRFEEPGPTLLASRHGVEIMASGARLGIISANQAEIGPASVHGDFFSPGKHWRESAALISTEMRRVERSRAEQRRSSGQGARSRWKGDFALLAPDLRTAAIAASEDLRLRRTAAYPRAVSVASGRFELRFSPVELSGGVPSTAFMYSERGIAIQGRLWLQASSDPLPLTLAVRGQPLEEARLHALVLLAFCALSVMPDFGRPQTRRASRPRMQATSTTRGSRRLPRSARRRSSTTQLEATGKTARAHWVVGHVRQLSEGREASPEAIELAAAVGIALQDGETWVQPHVRGFGARETLTFRWRAPDVVARSLRHGFDSIEWKSDDEY